MCAEIFGFGNCASAPINRTVSTHPGGGVLFHGLDVVTEASVVNTIGDGFLGSAGADVHERDAPRLAMDAAVRAIGLDGHDGAGAAGLTFSPDMPALGALISVFGASSRTACRRSAPLSLGFPSTGVRGDVSLAVWGAAAIFTVFEISGRWGSGGR